MDATSPKALDAVVQMARVLWISPSTPAERSIELVAPALQGRAEIIPKVLEVWETPTPGSYTLDDEVEGIRRVAERHVVGVIHASPRSARDSVR